MIQSVMLGAIDIGSNAVRLLITSVEHYPRETLFKKAAFVRVPIRLGEDVFTSGTISDTKCDRLCEAMEGFAHLMKSFGVERMRACATSAMREATNGAEVAARIEQSTGIKIEIISGSEEAALIFSSGANEMVEQDRSYILIDVGGGSTEVSVYSNGNKAESKSFGLGTVRMLNDKVKKGEWDDFRKWLKKLGAKYDPAAIVGSGGNINKVAKLLNKKERESVSYTEIKVLYDYLKTFSYEERIHLLKLDVYRADVIVPAMKIFLAAAKSAKINEFIVPKRGLVDGVVRQLYNQYVGAAQAESAQ